MSFQALGQNDQVESLLREVVEIDRRALCRTDPGYMVHLNNLAEHLRIKEQSDEAEQLFREVLEIAQVPSRGGHPFISGCKQNLALLFEKTGKF